MPQTRRIARRRPLALAVLAGLAATALTVPVAQAGPGLGSSPTPRTAAITTADSPVLSKQAAAHRALLRVQRVMAGKATVSARARRSPAGDATMALRSAWLQRDAMSSADRAAFAKANARPATSNVKCSAVVCVHWTPSETKTSFAMLTLKVMTRIHTTYVRAGYRGPKSDGKLGGNAKPDIYMDDIGDQNLYGYCTSDQQYLVAPGRYDVWAFCVLDNNFSRREFPTNTPVENLKVTAAHEYFHANQYAYDANEDRWLLEATAVWAEDQLYDGVDDNLQYLSDSPLTRPARSLDTGASAFGVYGDWIFFRYLTERFTQKRGPLPKLILDIFKRADSSRGKRNNQYSSQAVNSALRMKGTTLGKAFAQFSDANLRPARTYAEGKVNRYPGAPATPFVLKPGALSAGGKAQLNHLSSASAAVIPQGLGAAGWKLRIKVDLGALSRGSAAVVTTYFEGGRTVTKLVTLNRAGDGQAVTPFSSAKIIGVAVTLANTSARFRCNRGTLFSCGGRPLDQNVTEQFTATAFK